MPISLHALVTLIPDNLDASGPVHSEPLALIKPTDGWQSWYHNPMVQYLVAGSNLKMRFRCNDGHAGWIIPLTGDVDETIRRHLRDMSNGRD